MAGPRCQPCATVGMDVPAQTFCENCEEFYCGNCSRYHTRFKMAAEHIITKGLPVPAPRAGIRLYQNVPDVIFDVEVSRTEASDRQNLHGKYRLRVGRFGVALLDMVSGNMIYDWSFHYVRRFGVSSPSCQFILEAGRMCKSGEGTFRLKSDAYQDIYRTVMTRIKAMKTSR